jgi:hypothetical protein
MSGLYKPSEFSLSMDSAQVVRITYKVSRILKRGWVLSVCCRVASLPPRRAGGGGFVVKAAFETNAELCDWMKAHPLPKPWVGTLDGSIHKVKAWGGPIFHSLGERIFWGKPLSGRSHDILASYNSGDKRQ